MIVVENLLVRAKAYADEKWGDESLEHRIANQGFIDGYKQGYDFISKEWLEYNRMISQQSYSIQWHRVLLAFALGILVSRWV